jgi:sulfofructose kinase
MPLMRGLRSDRENADPCGRQPTLAVDVLTIGFACNDLVFFVDRHPAPDEKCRARRLLQCGGGPAANAAVAAARLGCRAAFAGYLGDDFAGRAHLEELEAEGVATDFVVCGESPTAVAAVLVKPDGLRTVVSHFSKTPRLTGAELDLTRCRPAVLLCDGHQPELSLDAVRWAGCRCIPTLLDAGSVNEGTRALAGKVDYLVAAEKFAREYTGQTDPWNALTRLAKLAANVVITLGAGGVVWQRGKDAGRLPACEICAVDTTGAGDAFHGALAAALAGGMPWMEGLRYASAAGALSCRRYGARTSLPTKGEVEAFIEAGRVH